MSAPGARSASTTCVKHAPDALVATAEDVLFVHVSVSAQREHKARAQSSSSKHLLVLFVHVSVRPRASALTPRPSLAPL